MDFDDWMLTKDPKYHPTDDTAVLRRLRECWNDAQKCAATAADSERLEWLMRSVSGKEFRRIGVTYGGNCDRDRIDAAMKPHNANVCGLPHGKESK